jgi:hypothetical protein
MFKYIKYLSVVTLLFLTTVSVAKAEESTTKASELVPGLDFIISADNMYSVESANFKTEFGIEAEATNLGILVGLYPLVHWDSQDASEYKAEITWDLDAEWFQLSPHADVIMDRNLEHQETTVGVKISKRF